MLRVMMMHHDVESSENVERRTVYCHDRRRTVRNQFDLDNFAQSLYTKAWYGLDIVMY